METLFLKTFVLKLKFYILVYLYLKIIQLELTIQILHSVQSLDFKVVFTTKRWHTK